MYVIKGGCGAHHAASFRKTWPNGLDNPVLLILRSQGDFHVGDARFMMESGDAIMIAPHTPYHYHNPYGEYIDDWMHIGLEDGESLPEEITCNAPIHLDDRETCSILLRQLLWESAYTDERFLKENTDALFKVLMNHLVAAPRQHASADEITYTQRLKDIRFRMQHTLAEPHTIHEHAGELGISDSHFQHLYTAVFGVPFQQDLIRMRIANAEFALQTTDMAVTEIAALCGYTSEVHFFRQFKQYTGMTPAAYRRKHHTVEKE